MSGFAFNYRGKLNIVGIDRINITDNIKLRAR